MKCPFFWLLVHGENREWVPLGDRAVSKLRLWPCVHNFMNTHTLYNHCNGYFQLSVYYSSKFTHCIHPLWSRGNPHHLAANPHLHSYCLTGFYPSWNTGHSWFLRCCVHSCTSAWDFFFSTCTWWSLTHSLRDEHATWSTLVFAPASPSQRRTPLLTTAYWVHWRPTEWMNGTVFKSVPCISGKSLCQVW